MTEQLCGGNCGRPLHACPGRQYYRGSVWALPELDTGDGMFTTAGLTTPREQAAIYAALCQREQARAERERLAAEAHNRKVEQAEREKREKCQKIAAEHRELVDSATGLRKALLELHEPDGDECSVCAAGDYMEDFPCDNYVLARDWRGGEADVSRTVYALVESDWSAPTVHAVFESEDDAERVLAAIHAEAKALRDYPDTCHDIELNLHMEKFDFRPAGDTALTLRDVMSDLWEIRHGQNESET